MTYLQSQGAYVTFASSAGRSVGNNNRFTQYLTENVKRLGPRNEGRRGAWQYNDVILRTRKSSLMIKHPREILLNNI